MRESRGGSLGSVGRTVTPTGQAPPPCSLPYERITQMTGLREGQAAERQVWGVRLNCRPEDVEQKVRSLSQGLLAAIP